jgi:hypothetical protein
MTYESRIDRTTIIAILLTIAVLLAGANYWIGGPVLLVLFLAAYPRTYQLTVQGLKVRDALGSRVIPYETISRLAMTASGVKIEYAFASELLVTTANPRGFFTDLSARTPHLTRRCQGLVLAAV